MIITGPISTAMGDGVVPLMKYVLLVSLICLGLYYMLGVNLNFNYVAENTQIKPSRGASRGQTHEVTRGPKYSRLTRLGSQLNFNYATCPNSSLMLNSNSMKRGTPLHDDCPQVFILGARKGGTTSLISYLSGHPNFTGANQNDPDLWHRGGTGYFGKFYTKQKWSAYKAKFVGDGHVLGESSVENFVDCLVPSRMYKSCGDHMKSMKFIVLLRDPVERFQSNYRFRVHNRFSGYREKDGVNMSWFVKKEIKDFYDGVHKRGLDIDTMQNHLNDLSCMFRKAITPNAIYEGLYLVHLHLWLCNAPAENILILNSKEFFHHTTDVLSEVIHFIGLSPLSNEMITSIVSPKYNANPEIEHEKLKHSLSQSERQRIENLYHQFNLKLLDILHWPRTLWS